MPRKVTRYRSKTTGQYISKAQWLRNRSSSIRQRERYVKGVRRKSLLQRLLASTKKPVIVRLMYKNKKIRKAVHLEVTYVNNEITQVKINRTSYTRLKDIEAFSSLIAASTEER
jgi:hypothetical protein